MKKLLFLLLILIPSVSAVQILGPFTSCDEHGAVKVKIADSQYTLYTEDFQVFARQQGKAEYKLITGKWSSPRLETKESVYFESDQKQFRQKAMYDIEIKYLDINKQEQRLISAIQCPGMVYNCELFNITIEQCYTKDNEFIAYLYLGGSVPSENPNIIELDPEKDFDYFVKAEKPFEDVNEYIAKTGGLPKYAEFTKLGEDRYKLKALFKDNNVLNLKVSYSAANMGDCPPNYNVDDELLYDAGYCDVGEKEVVSEANGEVSSSAEEEKKNYTPYLIIGGCIFLGFVLIAFVIKRKK